MGLVFVVLFVLKMFFPVIFAFSLYLLNSMNGNSFVKTTFPANGTQEPAIPGISIQSYACMVR